MRREHDKISQTGPDEHTLFLSCTNIMHMANGLIQFGNINYSNLSRYFRGYMEEIRLSNIVRYTDNFTPQSLR